MRFGVSVPKPVTGRHDFPNDFVFGAATSAYQVEGGYDADGKGMSNWDEYTLKRKERILDKSNGCVAIDQYNRYKEDVMLMKQLGLDAYRFSIAWSRILPGGRLSAGINKKGVQYYNNLIDFCITQGIQPYVTLFHFDLPQCLEDEYGGFLSYKIIDDFAEYAELCFKEFGDRVKHWITLNEPWTFAHNAYVHGVYPPGHGEVKPVVPIIPLPDTSTSTTPFSLVSGFNNSFITTRSIAVPMDICVPPRCPTNFRQNTLPYERFYPMSSNFNPGISSFSLYNDTTTYIGKPSLPLGDAGKEPYDVGHHLLLAHAKAVDIYRKNYQGKQKGKIGITNMTTWYEPLRDNPEDKAAASRALDFMWGWFMSPITNGDYPKVMRENVGERLPKFTDEEKILIQGSYDFIGLNYYTTHYAVHASVEHGGKPTYYTDQQCAAVYKGRDGRSIGDCPGSGWLYIVPSGIYKLLMHTKEKYNDPLIYITENGMSDKNIDPKLTITTGCEDDMRTQFYIDHLSYTKKAIMDGVNVKAYFLWSMFDNFEWGDGYTVRFGIFFVDFDKDLARYPKKSAKWWMEFLKQKNTPRLTK